MKRSQYNRRLIEVFGPGTGRSGVTLSEVLASMLVMSIGVVSLATLFPISVLRTAQATQLTHAVFLRQNAEAKVESNLGLLNNYYMGTMSNDYVGTFVAANLNMLPQTDFTNATNTPLPFSAVVDPLGFNIEGTAANGFDTLGGIVARSPGVITANVFLFNQLFNPASITPAQALSVAQDVASLPDSWSLAFEDTVASYNAAGPSITVNLNPANYGVNVTTAQPVTYRLVITDGTGKLAAIKIVTGVAGNTLSWSTAALPFTPARVRVEAQSMRYTYLLTVRKTFTVTEPQPNPPLSTTTSPGTPKNPNWVADVNCAVFFNRVFQASSVLTGAKPIAGDETPFVLTFPVNGTAASTIAAGGTGFDGQPGVAGVDDNGDLTVDNAAELGWAGSDDNRTVIINPVFNALGNVTAPYLRKGSYILEADPTNNMLEWYRIVDFQVANPVAVILLDRDVLFDPKAVTGGNPKLQGIFMKGIVDVFPMGSIIGQN